MNETEGMMPDALPCPEQQRLAEKVQRHLIRIAEVSHAAADAVANGNENLVRDLDKLVENELGAKDRALGASSTASRGTRLLIDTKGPRSRASC